MRRQFILLSILSLIGVAGILLKSFPLMTFLLFLLFLIPAYLPVGKTNAKERFMHIVRISAERAFIMGMVITGCIILIASIIASNRIIMGYFRFESALMLLVVALYGCFALTNFIFIIGVFVGCISKK